MSFTDQPTDSHAREGASSGPPVPPPTPGSPPAAAGPPPDRVTPEAPAVAGEGDPSHSKPVPPPPAPVASPPAEKRSAANTPSEESPGANTAGATKAEDRRADGQERIVSPPPPPPRATPVPVRRPAESPAAPSGVGSAKGVRWRGELETVRRPDSANHVGETRQDVGEATLADEPIGEEGIPEVDRGHVTKLAPPWLISTILHLILLLVLALITTPVGQGISRVMLEVGESDRASGVELTEFAIETDESLSDDSDAMEDAPVEVDIPMIFDAVEPIDLIQPEPVETGTGPPVIDAAPMFSGRSGSKKEALLAMYGGTSETQDAVALGLAWLKRNQEKAGSWSMRGPYSDGSASENRVAATAMALLAFLGDGNTHFHGEYSDEVKKGLKFLVGEQQRTGQFKGPSDNQRTYAQAQAMIALCEAYAMTNDSWLRDPAQSALRFAMEAQGSAGGWRYQPNYDSDLSVTGWYMMGLQSGMSAGLEVDPSVLHNVTHFLDSVQAYEGAAYSYMRGRPPGDAMTAEGLLCRQYLGWPRDHPPMIRGVETLAYDYGFNINQQNVYYWYYATQVLHHYGGSPWREWNSDMRTQLPKAQVTRGAEKGSWAPQGDEWGTAGRLYTTCLSLYCLEVYYRHMPLYSAAAPDESG